MAPRSKYRMPFAEEVFPLPAERVSGADIRAFWDSPMGQHIVASLRQEIYRIGLMVDRENTDSLERRQGRLSGLKRALEIMEGVELGALPAAEVAQGGK